MTRVSCACLAAAALAVAHLPLTAAGPARFRHLTSVYLDGQGVGFSLPEAVACGASGEVVVGDTGNDRLVRFTFRDKTMSGGTAVAIPQLSSPSRVHLTAAGEIYALDGAQRRIVRLAPDGTFKNVVALDGVPPPATIVAKSFTLDPAGHIYVLDVFGRRVLVLNADAQFQRALPFPERARFVSDLAVDFAGNVLLLDSVARRIFSAAKDAAFTPLGGDLSEFVPTLPTYLTSSQGVIFVVEGSGSRIVGFGRDGTFLSRQLTMGWSEGSLNHPSQMCINERNEVFIADRDNSRVQVFQLIR